MSARVTDLTIGVCNHGKKCCPHTITGMIIQGSPSTMYDGLSVARFGDATISDCPHCGGISGIVIGSVRSNLIDGLSGQKIGNAVLEPFGMSTVVTGSSTCSDG